MKKKAVLINIIGCILGLSTFLSPYFKEVLIYISFFFPIFCIFLVRYYHGLISIEPEIRPNIPTISIGFILSCFGIIGRSFIDYNVLDHSNIWIPSIIIALLILTIYYFNNFIELISKKEHLVYNIFIILLIEGFSFYSVIIVNCMYDKSTPQIFETQILNKIEKSKKGGIVYYLIIEDWNNKFREKRIKTDYRKYYSSFIGEKLKIEQKRGKFDASWYYFIDFHLK